MLDKEIRYINGIAVNISNNYADYDKLLKQQRIINKELGFGDDEIDWDRKKYERDRRRLKNIERLKNTSRFA